MLANGTRGSGFVPGGAADGRTDLVMMHPIHKVTRFHAAGPYRLRVDFDDDSSRTIDFRPVLEGELYGPLRDPSVFNAVSLDHDAHTLVWPNGADFDPATLHDWPEHEAEMTAMARRWSLGEKAG